MKLAEDVVHVFRSEAQAKDITFRLVGPDDGPIVVTVDSRRMQRVFINLVHNAIKYSPLHGVITLSIQAGPRDQAGSRDASECGGREYDDGLRTAYISVEDEGPGIEADDLPHLFDMFFRKKDGQDYRIGRGLGLHFCRLVVEAHHGVIRAGNRATGGARFTVELPLLQDVPCLSRC